MWSYLAPVLLACAAEEMGQQLQHAGHGCFHSPPHACGGRLHAFNPELARGQGMVSLVWGGMGRGVTGGCALPARFIRMEVVCIFSIRRRIVSDVVIDGICVCRPLYSTTTLVLTG